MNNRKTMIRFFTVADYEEEEIWLRGQHKNGWKLSKTIPPCFFIFEKCQPEDVIYRLDYKNKSETNDYFQIFKDYGWEYIGQCVGWLYFRKPLSETDCEQDREIFSDSESRIHMIDHVIKTRLLPIFIIYLVCVMPNFIRNMENMDSSAIILTILFAALTILYIFLLVYCGLKLRKMRNKYGND